MADHPNPNTACEHGHHRRKCPHCEIVQLEAHVQALREAIKKYGNHKLACASMLGGYSCTCGLTAALGTEPRG